jgi:hypothetical protein
MAGVKKLRPDELKAVVEFFELLIEIDKATK